MNATPHLLPVSIATEHINNHKALIINLVDGEGLEYPTQPADKNSITRFSARKYARTASLREIGVSLARCDKMHGRARKTAFLATVWQHSRSPLRSQNMARHEIGVLIKPIRDLPWRRIAARENQGLAG